MHRLISVIALACCCETTGGKQLSVGPGPTTILVGSTGEIVIDSDAVRDGLPGGRQHLYPDLLKVEATPSGIFKASVEGPRVILEATKAGDATITVWGRANGHESALTFPVRAAHPQGFGYRVYAGPPGYTDIEAGDEIRLVTGMSYHVLPYIRGPGRGLESGEGTNADVAGGVLQRGPDRNVTPHYNWRLSSDTHRTVALPSLGFPGTARVVFAEPSITIEWSRHDDDWSKAEFRAVGSDGAPIHLPASTELAGTWTITTPDVCGGFQYGSGIADVKPGEGPHSGTLVYGHVLVSNRPGVKAACSLRVTLQRTGRPAITVTASR